MVGYNTSLGGKLLATCAAKEYARQKILSLSGLGSPTSGHQRPALPHVIAGILRGGLQSIFRFLVSSDRRWARRFTSTGAPSESAVDKTEPEEVDVDSSGASVQEVEDSAVDVVLD